MSLVLLTLSQSLGQGLIGCSRSLSGLDSSSVGIQRLSCDFGIDGSLGSSKSSSHAGGHLLILHGFVVVVCRCQQFCSIYQSGDFEYLHGMPVCTSLGLTKTYNQRAVYNLHVLQRAEVVLGSRGCDAGSDELLHTVLTHTSKHVAYILSTVLDIGFESTA